MQHAVKFVEGSDDQIEGLAIPYGGPWRNKAGKPSDLHGEYFSPNTDFCLDWFAERPLLYEHGLDDGVGTAVVGRVKRHSVTDAGVWIEAQLDKSSGYFSAIQHLVKQGKLFQSSGAMAHLVDVDGMSGEIRRWPWVEDTLTPQPANLLAVVQLADAEKHFKSAGLVLPELKATWSTAYQDDLPDSSFAYIEAGGEKDDEGKTEPRSKRHFPYKDKDGKADVVHVRDALGRISQSDVPQAGKDKALAKIRAAAKDLGIEVADEASKRVKAQYIPWDAEGSYEDLIADLSRLLNANPLSGGWCSILATYPDYLIAAMYDGDEDCDYCRVDYSIGPDQEPVLGAMRPVDIVFAPSQPEADEMPLGMEAGQMAMRFAAFVQRAEALGERRVKEGRVLSTANRAAISKAHAAMGEAMTHTQALLDATDPEAKAVRAAGLATDLELLRAFGATLDWEIPPL